MPSTELVHVPPQLPGTTSAKPLSVEVAAFLLSKKRRLSPITIRGYKDILRKFVNDFPDHTLDMFEPPSGALIIEDWLNSRWGSSAPSTYNRSHSVLSSFFAWHVKRMNILRDPMQLIDKAKKRQTHRTIFTEEQVIAILMANPYPRDQIALRLLLFYALRKGALKNVRFEHFNHSRRELTIFTKGGAIQKLQLAGDVIWDLLDELEYEPSHYLLPKQERRRRIPPYREEIEFLQELFAEARGLIEILGQDDHCIREVEELAAHLDLAGGWVDRLIDAATRKTNVWPDEPISDVGLHRLWYRWLARAGIVPKGITFGERMHKARHTAAQRVLDVTKSIKAAQKLLGHKSAAVTEVYTEFSDEDLGETMTVVLGGVETNISQTLQRRAASRARRSSR